MGIKHCHNCSKCCEVIILDNVSPGRVAELVREGRVDKLYGEILVPITRAEALKRNPRAVLGRERMGVEKGDSRHELYFYSCPKLIEGKCSVYDRRPSMCSQYPLGRGEVGYVDSHAWLSKRQYLVGEPGYSDTCSYLPKIIPVKNI